MTIEELDIIVEASIEPALKEIKKLMPQIKQQVTQAVEVAQQSMEKINVKSVSNKFQKAIQVVKNKFKNLINSSKENEIAIKVNNKEASKQITQLEKEIDSLEKKIKARKMKIDLLWPKLDKMTVQEDVDYIGVVTDKGVSKKNEIVNKSSSSKEFQKLSAQEEKLVDEIRVYSKYLDEAKAKMSQLKQETNQTATSQNKLTSFFSTFKSKIDQAKGSIGNVKNSFNQIPKITQNITNNIKGMGKNLKIGLGHILKYAGALFSLRGIYSALSSSAQSWLSSQNAGAQQLSANIDYMKYAMGSALAPVIQFVTNLVYQLMKAIQSVAFALTGVNIFAKATASSMNSAAGSAKKAKKEVQGLAGIHNEINNVKTQDNSDSGGTVSPSFDLSQMENMSDSILDALKNGDWYQVGALIGVKLNEAMDNIPWDKIQNTAKQIGKNIAQLLNGFIETTDWKKVGNTIAEGLNAAIYFASEFVKTFKWNELGTSVGNTINGFVEKIDTKILGRTISDVINGGVDYATGLIETTDWSNLGYSIGNTIGIAISHINWANIGKAIVESFGSIREMLQGIGEGIVDGILEGIAEKIWGEGTGNFIFALIKFIIDIFKDKLGIHSPSTVMRDEVGSYMGLGLIEGLKNGLSNIWESIGSIFTNLVSDITNKFTEIKNNVVSWASSTKETIEGWGNNVKIKISDCWNNVSTTVKSKVDIVKSNISSGLSNAKSTITTWANNVKTNFSNCWNNAYNTVSSKISSIKSNIASGLNNIKSSISSWGSNIKSSFNSTFSNVVSSAITWGKDLANNMASGIRSGIYNVKNAASSIAASVKNFLGFSEPDEGPLSNFHTYMPDMIDLMVRGIHNNIDRVTKELENLTTNMSYTINTPNITTLPLDATLKNTSTIQPRNVIGETLSDILIDNVGNNNISIPLSIYVGNKKLGQILLDNLRDMKRQTGKDIEALVGG